MAAFLNILVVEDHDLLRNATVEMLCDHGHNATGVYCAEDVDDIHVTHTPDLYIVDLMLPGEDGLSLAKRLRRSRPGAGIVIVTARCDLEDRLSGYETGADVYLCKPFDSEELLAVIGSIALRIKRSDIPSDLLLNSSQLSLTGPLGEVMLTHSEVNLLTRFIGATDQVLDHESAAIHFRLNGGPSDRANFNVRLSQMRNKLRKVGAEEPMIRAIRGHGYKLCLQINLV